MPEQDRPAADFDIADEAGRIKAKNLFDGNLVFGGKRFHEGTHRSGGSSRQQGPADGVMHREQAMVVRDTGQERYQRIEEFWEAVTACPVCGSDDRQPILTRFGLDVYGCNACTHQFMDPRIAFDKLGTLYAADKTAEAVYKSAMQKSIDEHKSAYGLALIEQLAPPGRERILDFGCGSGLFLEVAHATGWRFCVGIDANPGFRDEYRNEPGIQYVCATFESLEPDALGRDYDAVTLWNVLEHLYDLDMIVQTLRDMLKPGGLLFIMVPNAHSLATRLIRERSATFNWKHVSHFTPKSLPYLMERHDLDCVHLETAISEIENVKSYLSGAWPYSGHGDPEGLFEFITPEYIHGNLLGSRLIGVFRKSRS